MDVYELSRICEALGHPLRLSIYNLLLEKGESKASELFNQFKDEFNISSRQTIFNHLNALEIAGLIITTKEKGEVVAKLKKKVKIEVEDL